MEIRGISLIMKLPVEFLEKMRSLFFDTYNMYEYDLFLESFKKNRYCGLRVNTLKVDLDEFLKITPFKLKQIPWTCDGFYYDESIFPGKHPHYNAGLYYIQEPSAMFPANVLLPNPDEKVLDLCAAPGGKTVQLAAFMKNSGVLVANEINAYRGKALVKNIELCGVKNSIVTNETPQRLSEKFVEYFDKILVDAPCSGEGMFRKDQDSVKSWSKYEGNSLSKMQLEILHCTDKMLKPRRGHCYSTCTFSPEENEHIISKFLDTNTDYELIDIHKVYGIDNGIAKSCGNKKSVKLHGFGRIS